jgi:hypothetical protein
MDKVQKPSNSEYYNVAYGSVTNNNGFWIEWLDLLTPSF